MADQKRLANDELRGVSGKNFRRVILRDCMFELDDLPSSNLDGFTSVASLNVARGQERSHFRLAASAGEYCRFDVVNGPATIGQRRWRVVSVIAAA